MIFEIPMEPKPEEEQEDRGGGKVISPTGGAKEAGGKVRESQDLPPRDQVQPSTRSSGQGSHRGTMAARRKACSTTRPSSTYGSSYHAES